MWALSYSLNITYVLLGGISSHGFVDRKKAIILVVKMNMNMASLSNFLSMRSLIIQGTSQFLVSSHINSCAYYVACEYYGYNFVSWLRYLRYYTAVVRTCSSLLLSNWVPWREQT